MTLKLKSNTKISILIIIGAITAYFLLVNMDKIIPGWLF